MSGVVGATRRRWREDGVTDVEHARANFVWCGPDECALPDEPCRWQLCDETCRRRKHRHAHMRRGSHSTASGAPAPDGTRARTNRSSTYVPMKGTEAS
jgi:hypothetical protein